MRWTDTMELAIALDEAHPDVDVAHLRFTDLHRWILELPDFEGEPEQSSEGILEAIQMAWLAERN
ncbi:Fe-S cluster assembly protein IscX [Acidithiobacillus ferrianus]|uniref:Fe-S cluster assembly protein IscX n=2 Tax=Acidithiobacillus ferrianus TaxID=2678518 RepID=A0A845U7M4_9PROT|nr:Fe-S cluster assembly protein IscX [Acidithiobacillus ferrianus]NDU42159.1 Fe-S cluster assembly protein IscX [Acidithiobacillus ferrianus]